VSYWDISNMSGNADLTARVQACAAQEVDTVDPYTWTAEHLLVLCASPGWADAWASALASDNPTPGKDPAVITDGQILSAVQQLDAP
jgi:hypothetical protein